MCTHIYIYIEYYFVVYFALFTDKQYILSCGSYFIFAKRNKVSVCGRERERARNYAFPVTHTHTHTYQPTNCTVFLYKSMEVTRPAPYVYCWIANKSSIIIAHFVKKKNNNKSHIQDNFVYVANCLNYCPKLRSAAIDGLITIHTHTRTQRHTFDTTHAFGHCHGQVQMWPDQ